MNIDNLPFLAVSLVISLVVYWCYKEFSVYRREIIDIKREVIKLKNVIELELHGDISDEEEYYDTQDDNENDDDDDDEDEEDDEDDEEYLDGNSKDYELSLLGNPNVIYKSNHSLPPSQHSRQFLQQTLLQKPLNPLQNTQQPLQNNGEGQKIQELKGQELKGQELKGQELKTQELKTQEKEQKNTQEKEESDGYDSEETDGYDSGENSDNNSNE